MKNKASGLLRQMISVIKAMVKAKTVALKSKTRAIKTRLIIFSLLRNRKILMTSISEKLQTLMQQRDHHHHHKNYVDNDVDDDDDYDDMGSEQSKKITVHNAMSPDSLPHHSYTEFAPDQEQAEFENKEEEEEECDDEKEKESNNKYPELRHSLFDLELLEDPAGGSVIDLVKNSKPEGEEFKLEDEIDQVAELFIKRFHHQMRIQKQLSFKRYEELLATSA